jgi:hypothetical protein
LSHSCGWFIPFSTCLFSVPCWIMRQLIHGVSFDMCANLDKYILSGLVKRNTKFCILCKTQCPFCSLKNQKLLINSKLCDWKLYLLMFYYYSRLLEESNFMKTSFDMKKIGWERIPNFFKEKCQKYKIVLNPNLRQKTGFFFDLDICVTDQCLYLTPRERWL